jgi:quinol-cytochrome oxidoreductase complex cytochrome b subunit
MFQTLRMLPAHILFLEGELVGILGIGLAGALWLVVPFLDSPDGRGTRARAWTMAGWLAIVYIIVFTLLMYRGGGGH